MPHHTIHTKLWNDPRFRKLKRDAKLLYLFLVTCPVGNAAGLYRLDLDTITFHTGIPANEALALMNSLDELHITYEDEVAWVEHFLEHQTRSPHYLKAVAKSLEGMPESLVGRMLDFYADWDIPIARPKKQKKAEGPFEEIVALYKAICPRPFAQPDMEPGRKITEHRYRIMARAWREVPDLKEFEAVFRKAAASDFLSGKNGKWRADFDWLIEPKNFAKVREGKYDSQTGRTITTTYTRPEQLRGRSGFRTVAQNSSPGGSTAGGDTGVGQAALERARPPAESPPWAADSGQSEPEGSVPGSQVPDMP